MLLTRKNPLGGPVLRSFPYAEDPETNSWGIKLGYVGKCPNCHKISNEPVIIKMTDATLFANEFADCIQSYRVEAKRLLKKRIKVNWRKRVAIWLLGDKEHYEQLKEQYQFTEGD